MRASSGANRQAKEREQQRKGKERRAQSEEQADLVVETQVEHGVHHAGHRNSRTWSRQSARQHRACRLSGRGAVLGLATWTRSTTGRMLPERTETRSAALGSPNWSGQTLGQKPGIDQQARRNVSTFISICFSIVAMPSMTWQQHTPCQSRRADADASRRNGVIPRPTNRRGTSCRRRCTPRKSAKDRTRSVSDAIDRCVQAWSRQQRRG